MSVRQQPVKDFRSDYATRTDFCDAFTNHTRSFYLLAFLLTRSHAAAENCLIDTIEQAFKPDTVFREWTTSWIKRTLIARAITTVFDASNPGELITGTEIGAMDDGQLTLLHAWPISNALFLSCRFWRDTRFMSVQYCWVVQDAWWLNRARVP